jgi:hypothetical protein
MSALSTLFVIVAAATNYKRAVSLWSAHFNIIAQVCQAIRKSPLRWSFQHVKGHVDGPFLTRWERLNVVADGACK